MILDHISNYKKYVNMHPAFPEAFAFLNKLEENSRGGFTIDGKKLFASVAEVKGRGKKTAKLEAHSQYIDIQYILDGTDCIGWSDADDSIPGTEYDREKDYRFVNIKPKTWLNVGKGCFVVFFPEDAHAPLAGNKTMTKVFMKVKLEYL